MAFYFYLSPTFKLRSSRAHWIVHESTMGSGPFLLSSPLGHCSWKLGFCASYSTLLMTITRGACPWRMLHEMGGNITYTNTISVYNIMYSHERPVDLFQARLTHCRCQRYIYMTTQQGTRYIYTDELLWLEFSEKNLRPSVGVCKLSPTVYKEKTSASRPYRYLNFNFFSL
jgi:uncharacterized protein YlbG (UPF0298 family)